ncbi:MAG: hypothetical protein WCD21_21270 [Streptomyces sp.]
MYLLNEGTHSLPWAGGDRDLRITITPTRITGRRIAARHTHTHTHTRSPLQ